MRSEVFSQIKGTVLLKDCFFMTPQRFSRPVFPKDSLEKT
ncbi:hypothetical protein HMPREF0556_11085 [Listeria grayi DSM 20601]|uniref:Uncharacterized protein n=1 Tax=Listeria grayi DSM 20601 TaxID=525367 RepID=D7UXX4_LISGR|nr:hypothetical protein HMPREF0556_11085 [Listeria grayi DSM 20601]